MSLNEQHYDASGMTMYELYGSALGLHDDDVILA